MSDGSGMETGVARALPKERVTASKQRRRDWRKAMSDNIAYALLVYTLCRSS